MKFQFWKMKNHGGVSSPCHLSNQSHKLGKTVKDNDLHRFNHWDLHCFNPGGAKSHSFFEEISCPLTDKIESLSHYVEGPLPMQDNNRARKIPLRLTMNPAGRSLTRQEHQQMQQLVQQYYKAAEEHRLREKIAFNTRPLKGAIQIKQDLEEYWGRLDEECESRQWKIMMTP